MSDIKVTKVHDFGDGEVHINIVCDFTIYTPQTDLEKVKKEFHDLMRKYAI